MAEEELTDKTFQILKSQLAIIIKFLLYIKGKAKNFKKK